MHGYDIFAKWQRGWEKIFEGGRRGNVKQRVVIEARWITNAAITAILQ